MPEATSSSKTAPLLPLAREVFPLGSVEPRGWLRDQLAIQAEGLTGHLEEIWPSVGADSGWLGGGGESWERGPYYLDGLVPLAYLLHDAGLIARAQKWLEWSLSSQRADGFFGPATNTDWWPRMLMLKALIQYQEATSDERVIPFMARYFAYQAAHLRAQPLQSWAAARGGENIYAIYWLHRRTGEAALLDLARLVESQTLDWTDLFTRWPYTRPIRDYHDVLGFMDALDGLDPASRSRAVGAFNAAGNFHLHHVVNLAMALKQPALAWRMNGSERQFRAPRLGIEALMRYHGLANGLFSGDEHLSGQQPFQGTELCAVVETLFSLQNLAQVYDDHIAFIDWAEELAYNALPAAFSADMWSHQYDQQPNQVLVSRARRAWYDNTDDSNLFGLEPHFGCCTANYHQGWPKFVSNLWLRDADGALSAGAYGPCCLRTVIEGVPVEVTEDTGYPFRESIRFTVTCQRPAAFTLRLRVPAWCDHAHVRAAGTELHPSAGATCELRRVWSSGDVIELFLPMEVRLNKRPANAVAVQRGPLIFALAPAAEWRPLDGGRPYDNHEVLPRSPWNYALVLDSSATEAAFHVEQREIARQPFDSAQPPLVLHTQARRVPGWELVQNSAGPLPESPVSAEGELEQVTLVPYGAAKLRVTEFPWSK